MEALLALPLPLPHQGRTISGPIHVLKRTAFGKHRWVDVDYHRCVFTPSCLSKGIKYHLKAFRASTDSGEVTPLKELDSFPPPGCTRLKVELKKPLGVILEEDKVGNIFVAEIVKGGNADKSGLVDVGDQLIATSAIVYGTEEFYQGVKVRKGMQIIRLTVYGEKFDTVMAAIGTHPAHVKVTLELQKCKRPTALEAESNGAAN